MKFILDKNNIHMDTLAFLLNKTKGVYFATAGHKLMLCIFSTVSIYALVFLHLW